MVTIRPVDEEELQRREASGTIRASRFVREYAKTKKPITVDTIYSIHKEIFRDAWPEIAGKLRTEDVKITDSHHLPPHYSKVPGLMRELDEEFKILIAKLKSVHGVAFDGEASDEELGYLDQIIKTSAWIHHKITHIHPFVDGNGRTARLIANLVLERFGLVGISIKIERENKNRYRQALSQIDDFGDFEPLMNIIAEELVDRYNGVRLKIA